MDWTDIGINYQKANLEQRHKYALSEEQIVKTYDLFKNADITSALILSTCNRTEYFVPSELIEEAKSILSTKVYKTELEGDFFHSKEDDDADKPNGDEQVQHDVVCVLNLESDGVAQTRDD